MVSYNRTDLRLCRRSNQWRRRSEKSDCSNQHWPYFRSGFPTPTAIKSQRLRGRHNREKAYCVDFLVAGWVYGRANEDMSWVRKSFNDDMGRYAAGLMDSMDTVVLGRATYEIMTNAWPNLTEETGPGAGKMNSVTRLSSLKASIKQRGEIQ